jgi:hypothetical protein
MRPAHNNDVARHVTSRGSHSRKPSLDSAYGRDLGTAEHGVPFS